jgi:hypothetical protein
MPGWTDGGDGNPPSSIGAVVTVRQRKPDGGETWKVNADSQIVEVTTATATLEWAVVTFAGTWHGFFRAMWRDRSGEWDRPALSYADGAVGWINWPIGSHCSGWP